MERSLVERNSLEVLPASTLGQYRIRGKIGSGGMGDVYDAVHTTLDKRVAIKTLRKRFLDEETVVARFLREGQLASRIRHPNIVDVTDVGVIGGLPCLVMEHLEGETLSNVIRREGALAVSELVDVVLPVIAAVDFAHDHGVLHRDLKPSNIFLSRSWNGEVVPKVLDFGISKLVHESAQAALTTDSAFVGTPHYASPELMRADKGADGRSDQYAMGVILYEGATGTRPFVEKGGSFVALAMAICEGTYPAPREINPDLPEAFERVIRRAMATNPDDRFLTMRTLGEALLPFASERVRLIWTPTFRGSLSHAPSETAVIPRPSGSINALSGTNPSLSASQQALRSSHNPVVLPVQPNYSGVHPSMTPPANMHDRLPTFTPSMSIQRPLPPSNGWAAPLLVIGGIAIVASIAAGFLVIRSSTRSNSTYAPATSATPSGPMFTVDVRPVPETAVVEIDGLVVGTGKVSRSFARDGRQHMLRLSAPGYETLLLPFDDQRPPPETLALRGEGPGGSKGQTASNPPSSATPTAATAAPPGPAHVPNMTGQPHNPPINVPPSKGTRDPRPRTDNIDPWE